MTLPPPEDFPPTGQTTCPVPTSGGFERVTLAHGEGGRMMRQLIRERILSLVGNESTNALSDSACLPRISGELAVTTDSFVVSPLFFPGGDIGSLAVYGTVNDLAVSGARPLYLTLSLILEEGFSLELLDRVLGSVAQAAKETGISIVAGDTKVVPQGAADGVFINTTGVGEFVETKPVGSTSLREGDSLIISGPIGRHGIAVLCAREDLALEPPPHSDLAPLTKAARLLQQRLGTRIRAMRDATRGGVAAVLHEWAEACQLSLEVDERALPVSPEIRGACELLGLDPLHVANEGTMCIAVAPDAVDEAVRLLRTLPETAEAAEVGTVASHTVTPVAVRHALGGLRPLDEPLGAPLPRIC